MSLNLELIVLGFLIIWVIILSVSLFRSVSHYNRLTKGVINKGLGSILENIIKDLNKAKKDISYLKEYCDTIQKEGVLHIQKVGLLRFNPFKDTGGNQSFILAIVDGEDTGIIISGLYSRSGTRWYAKRLLKGKAVEHELSNEEKEALKMANRTSAIKN